MFIRQQLDSHMGFLGLLSNDYYEACCEIFDTKPIASSAYWKIHFFGA